jgi:hypothetical protein
MRRTEPDRRTPRAATLFLLVLASMALFATSETGPRVSSEVAGQLKLTERQPLAELWVTVLISAETLSREPPPGLLVLSFTAPADRVPSFGSAKRLPLDVSHPADLMEIEGAGVNSCDDGGGEWCSRWDYSRFSLSACEPGQECRLALPVTVEFTQPPVGAELVVEWRAAATLEYPVGATPPEGTAILVDGHVR